MKGLSSHPHAAFLLWLVDGPTQRYAKDWPFGLVLEDWGIGAIILHTLGQST